MEASGHTKKRTREKENLLLPLWNMYPCTVYKIDTQIILEFIFGHGILSFYLTVGYTCHVMALSYCINE